MLMHLLKMLKAYNNLFEEIYKIDGVVKVEYNIITKKYKSRRLFT